MKPSITVEEFQKQVRITKRTEGPDGTVYHINCHPSELVGVLGRWLMCHVMQEKLKDLLSTRPGKVWTVEELCDHREALWKSEQYEDGTRKPARETRYSTRLIAEGLADLELFVASREHKGIKTTSEDLQVEWDRVTAEADAEMEDAGTKYKLTPIKEAR